jgi:hypothetical protein
VVIQEAQEAEAFQAAGEAHARAAGQDAGHRYGTERNSQGLHNRFPDDQEAEESHAGD